MAQKTDLETLAFRSGWLALSQFPFVALLLSQFNVISFATGVSRQRLKWLHRWLARTIFLLSTLHGALFLAQWIPNNFFWDELEIVPRVKHGLVAWAILAWAALSSVGPMRRLSYEFFIFQHMASALGFLLLLYWHIPKNHKFYVHFASAAIISDLVSRLLHFMYRNIEVLPKRLCRGRRRIGYEATVSAVDDDLTVLDVNGVDFSWTPGQYVYVWMPTFWLQSPHPFTIANSPSPGPDSSSHISLVMRTKGGFTKKLNRYAQAHVPGEKHRRLRVFISGPFGNPLSCTSYETLVFISASTGASFTIPVIESLAASSGVTMARRVHVLLVDRRKAHLEIYIQRLRQMLRECMGSGIVFHIKVAITAPPEVPAMNLDEAGGSSEPTGLYERLVGVDAQDRSQLSLEENDFELRGSSDSDKSFLRHSRESSVSSTGWDKELDIGLDNVDDPSVEEVTGRPDLEDYFEEIMDGACGRVAVFGT
ncbi:ferric reductase like transmembrane component-domain-containing protein [Phialemonium atrogriseum]|uniref:ferric-chelate reductase (NADPH) n=1 Tax=Phialemonium atrogriseum TaxID=1093897 RepID=A0AAJ0FJE8_9PEZI|nr:ferric reductase like transmembrane component-domain-containing protein [Phialemonium atrogriseum]KAK1763050.1 ferric reductase like transmembrane component-domain-containing protein [Phialemonium atrogriseum]